MKTLVVMIGMTATTPAFDGTLTPEDLRCEYLVNPLGIDTTRPRLSWELRAVDPEARGLRQNAYQVQVASSAELLARGKPDLWDSGKQRFPDLRVGVVHCPRNTPWKEALVAARQLPPGYLTRKSGIYYRNFAEALLDALTKAGAELDFLATLSAGDRVWNLHAHRTRSHTPD